MDTIESLTDRIEGLEADVKRLARESYPECALLMQVHGVAEITALTYVLTLEDPDRFAKSRRVGAFLGLTPGQRQSGTRDPSRHVTMVGDETLRRLLVQSAHRILGKRGPDSDLRRHGQKIMLSGTKDAKRRAAVAVARKLAILLHALLSTGEFYEPLRNERAATRLQKVALTPNQPTTPAAHARANELATDLHHGGTLKPSPTHGIVPTLRDGRLRP